MALLYEKSRVWRAIVHATKDPKILALFLGVSVGGASAVAWGSQMATDSISADTKKELEDLKRRDYETARYASHSKVALGKMFDNVRGDPAGTNAGADERRDAAKRSKLPIKQEMKLPGIAWHPKAVEREERAKKRKEKLAVEAAAAKPVSTSAKVAIVSTPKQGDSSGAPK